MSFEAVDDWLLGDGEGAHWEVFHENSKMSRHERHPTFALHPSDAAIVRIMQRLRRVKPFRDYPKVALPVELPAASLSVDDVIASRATARTFRRSEIGFAQLAKVLLASYGVTRDNADTVFPRPFRSVPSGGALYPLELYVHARRVSGLQAGLYHFDPEERSLDLLRAGDDSEALSRFMVNDRLAADAAAAVFVTAIFYRSTFKYGDRGYRFTLLEAGHLAQNACLTAEAMKLATATIGGYTDRDVDRWLAVDGLSESTVYVLLVGVAGVTEEGASGH